MSQDAAEYLVTFLMLASALAFFVWRLGRIMDREVGFSIDRGIPEFLGICVCAVFGLLSLGAFISHVI